MQVDRLILGSFQTNCYVLRTNLQAADCLIIDTGIQAEELVEFLQRYELNPVAVVLTHGHADHISGIAALRKSFGDIKVYIHKLDAAMLAKPLSNLSLLAGKFFKTGPADFLLEEGDVVNQAGIKLQVFHTPGHTRGGICLYSKDYGVVFVGDTLFADGVGRTDFSGGSMQKLVESIKTKLLTLPGQTAVYPGHGPATTISQEKLHNPYLR
jgi:hydroxyacylglutathione hydrolase